MIKFLKSLPVWRDRREARERRLAAERDLDETLNNEVPIVERMEAEAIELRRENHLGRRLELSLARRAS